MLFLLSRILKMLLIHLESPDQLLSADTTLFKNIAQHGSCLAA
jgi:hypothetical protein